MNFVKRIVIADDHPIFRKGLAETIKEADQFVVIDHSHDGEEAVQMVRQLQPHLVILDIEMPRKNGLEAAKEIAEVAPSARLIILTMHNNRAAFDMAMEIGVMGYVLKENAVSDIMQCMEAVWADNHYVSPQLSNEMWKARKAESSFHQLIALLTPAEKRILRMIADYKTSKGISEELFLSERTVQNHRLNIAKKLDLKGAHQILRFAIEYKDLIQLGVEES